MHDEYKKGLALQHGFKLKAFFSDETDIAEKIKTFINENSTLKL
jgi:hypothetical protein